MKNINFKINVSCWRDKQTKTWLIYAKKFNISAYGKTKAKAKKMFEASITEILTQTKPK